MKKKLFGIVLSMTMAAALLTGCGGKTSDNESTTDTGTDATTTTGLDSIAQPINEDNNSAAETTVTDDNTESEKVEGIVYISDLEAPEGQVYSELTGTLIDADIANQRPLAIMVDNELTALDHYGVNDCDIVYECMNSTANGRITRLMGIIKDYDKIERLGSVRSARTVNMVLSAEWNAILCHDGGPFYIDEYYSLPEISHLNGVFSRIDNGKSREFTEYVTASDIDKYLGDNASFDTEYNEYYTGAHFEFVENNAIDAGTYETVKDVTDIVLPYPHNSSELKYNPETNLYEYYEYGSPHVDGETGEVLAFRNVIVQCADYQEYDQNGYLYYKIQNNSNYAWYLTDGKAVYIRWYRGTETTDNTKYIDDASKYIYLNAGHTYITLCPSDVWDELELK